jgi:hypothetical protein
MEKERCHLIVPETCPECAAPYTGGSERPGSQFIRGLRVFYRCGSRISCGDPSLTENEKLHVRFKNCEKIPDKVVIESEEDFVQRYPTMRLSPTGSNAR